MAEPEPVESGIVHVITCGHVPVQLPLGQIMPPVLSPQMIAHR
jgi:hypothetical protein